MCSFIPQHSRSQLRDSTVSLAATFNMSGTGLQNCSSCFQSLIPRRKRHTKSAKKADSAELNSKDGRSEVVASYQYEPLPTREHTRVLALEPGPNDDSELPLVGSLKLLDLCDEDSEPFEAISYVWGPPEKTHVILLDGHPMRITASLRGALLQTRRVDQPRRLWADAICINQSDKDEKGHQVAAMGRVYKTSKRTLICLGVQNPEHAQHAAGLVDDVNLMIQNIQRDPDFSGEPGSFPVPAENDTIISDSRWRLGWNEMSSHPWFGRGWVVQEASLGHDACVLWASVQIEWTAILRVNYWVASRGWSAIKSQDAVSAVPRTLSVHHANSFARRHTGEASLFDKYPVYTYWASTLSTLFTARWLGLSDPRDRIYAFMALDTSDGVLGDLQLEPNYERPFERIYHDFAIKYIEATGDLDILSFIRHDRESLATPTMAEAIPSWVPRWDLELNILSPLRVKMGDHPKTFMITDNNSILRVRGLLLGFVEYSAAQEPYCRFDQRSQALQIVISLWKEIVAASGVNGGPYEERQAFAFIDVLCHFDYSRSLQEWTTRRQEFARHLQSYMPGSEPSSAIAISQRNESRTEQRSLEILSEEICSRGRRRFVILSRGYYGIAPPITRKGDLFALIYGTRTLSILRPVDGKPRYYQIVGPVYVESKTVVYPHGSNMMGEEGRRDWEEWGLTEEEINLC